MEHHIEDRFLNNKKSIGRQNRRLKKSDQIVKVIDRVYGSASANCIKKGEILHFSQTNKTKKM